MASASTSRLQRPWGGGRLPAATGGGQRAAAGGFGGRGWRAVGLSDGGASSSDCAALRLPATATLSSALALGGGLAFARLGRASRLGARLRVGFGATAVLPPSRTFGVGERAVAGLALVVGQRPQDDAGRRLGRALGASGRSLPAGIRRRAERGRR